MAVKTVEVTPPVQEPSLMDSVSSFLQNYWGFLLFLLAVAVAIYFFYYWRKERKKDEKTVYHHLHDKIEELCKMQVDKRRLQSNPMLFLGISGILGVITWVGCMILMGMTGLFVGLLLGSTVLVISGVIYYVFSPFVKRDMVFLRYSQNKVIHEKYLGDYAGEHYGSDAYLNILVYRGRKKVVFRDKIIIRIPQSIEAFYDLEKLQKDYESDEAGYNKALKKITEKYSEFINELVQFNDKTIVVNHAKSLDKYRFFYYPVFVDDMNHVISKGVRYYKSLKEQTALEQLYDLTDESSKAQIKAIQINPRVQFKQATGEDVIDEVDSDE